MIVRVLKISLLFLLVGAGAIPVEIQAQDKEQSVQPAQRAAQKWFTLIDEQELDDAWDNAAPFFRERTDRSTWGQRSTQLIDSLGTVSARSLSTVQRRDSLRRATGPFLILTYRTTIRDAPFREILVMTQHDKKWKVAGYQIASLQRNEPPAPPSP